MKEHAPRNQAGTYTWDEYQKIGKQVSPLDIALPYDRAQRLHDFISQRFLPTMMHYTPIRRQRIAAKFNDHHDIARCANSFGPHPLYAPDVTKSVFVGLSLKHTTNEQWSLRAVTNSYRHDGTANKVVSRHYIDASGGLLIQARKEVRIMQSTLDDELQAILEGPKDEMPAAITDRKTYEVPLTDRHCEVLEERLEYAMHRSAALPRVS